MQDTTTSDDGDSNGFEVEQRGLDGGPAEGQTSLDGGIVRDETERDTR